VGVLERVTVPLAIVAVAVPFADNTVVPSGGRVVVLLTVWDVRAVALVEIDEDVVDCATAKENEQRIKTKRREVVASFIMRWVLFYQVSNP
jgi:hypothetical protein